MDQLFVMELLVNQIEFPVLPVPQKKQIVVQAKCGTFANLEIRTDVMGALETQERSEKSKILDINCGKSLLFAIKTDILKKNLNDHPLEIAISTKLQTEPMGTANINWSKEFLDMIESTEDSGGYVTPVEYRDTIPLSKNGNAAGNVGIYLRLTYLGHSIDTHIQVISSKDTGNKQFLFKSNNNATTFQCQKYGLGSDTDVIPVAPIFKTAAVNLNQSTQPTKGGINQSVVSIFGKYASMASIQSVVPSVFRGITSNMINPQYGLGSSHPSDTQSIRERIPDKLFMNFLDVGSGSNSDGLSMDSDIDLDSLTIEQIEGMLCKHPDCPAAKLFKEFGIGPLAKGNGLGCVNLKTEAPLSYGLSHLNGTIDNYGPLGTYRRPKSPSQPFISKDKDASKCSSKSSCSTTNNSNSTRSRTSCSKKKGGLNGGCALNGITFKYPLRLKGGSQLNEKALKQPSQFHISPKTSVLQIKHEVPSKDQASQHVSNKKIDTEINQIQQNEQDIEKENEFVHLKANAFACGLNRENESKPPGKLPPPLLQGTDKYLEASDCHCLQCSTSNVSCCNENVLLNITNLAERRIVTKDNNTLNRRLLMTKEDTKDCVLENKYTISALESNEVVLNDYTHIPLNANICQIIKSLTDIKKHDSPLNNDMIRHEFPAKARNGVCRIVLPNHVISDELDLLPKKLYEREGSMFDVDNQTSFVAPLRLKGGGPICGTTENIPDPRHACQDLMDEFNKLLNDYKNALGPCGAATCPFSQNLVAESCRKACRPGEERRETGTINEDTEDGRIPPSPSNQEQVTSCKSGDEPNRNNSKSFGSCGSQKQPKQYKSACEDPDCPFAKKDDDELSACANPECPFKRDIINPADKDHKRDQIKSACGSPTCPFVREKYGIDDYEPEYPPLPCPGKGCPFQVPKQLPPIHWDCPDPLPKGECRNPECPLVNKDNIIEKYFPQPRSPCGSPTCPFAVVPCDYPGCPFSVNSGDVDPCPPTCPYSEPPPTELKCTPSICPFACPETKEEPTCDNSTCPFKKTTCIKEENKSEGSKSCKSCVEDDKNSESDITCDNPCCPYRSKANGDAKNDSKNDSKSQKSRFSSEKGGDYGDNGEPCTAQTCSKHGGGLSCKECGDGNGEAEIVNKQKEMVSHGDKEAEIQEKKRKYSVQQNPPAKKGKGKESVPGGDLGKKKHKKRRCGYVYDEGTYYPGNKVGHRFCVLPKFNVPPDMGWLWNVHTQCMSLRPRRGWKPGAIGRTIAKLINQHRKKLQMPLLDDKPKKKKRRRGLGGGYGGDSSDEEEVQLKPTLQVKKKDGIVYVTMNPLKDPKTIEDNENPYMDCSPMQFKIIKNKQKDFKMCYCGEENGEDVDVSSSSSSELDIEFTPPAGIIRPERLRKKKDVCHTDTQYNIEDCQLPKKEDTKKKKGKGKGKGKKDKKKK